MDFPHDQIEELKKLFPGVSICDDGGCTYLFIPNLELPDNCIPQRVDALLCPGGRDGYDSRLYFSQKIETTINLNWNAQNTWILDRNWFAFSYKVQKGLRLAQLVITHLRGLGR